ncbi:ATP-binding cassette domain-containing protein [bacterium]|nr:ATP-binding cassette domain-containing protein [bacterium]
MKDYAIKVHKLTRKFNGLTAVDSISFTVPNGELFGLLGPNGAGKTTTINMLSTLLSTTSGQAELAGFDVSKHRDEVRQNIGVVFQEPALDTKLTGKENLEFHAMMYGMGKKERKERVQEVLRLVDLTEKAGVLVENYSGGMKRRLEIARGLVHRPKVLFLDEPTLGLDIQTRRYIWDYVKRLNQENEVTIVLTTHYMEEADFLCERIAIMDYGKFVAMDSPDKLKNILGGDVVSLELEGDVQDVMSRMKELSWIHTVTLHGEVLSLTMESGERKIPQLINMAQQNGAQVSCVHLRKPSLDDVFLHYTGRSIRDQEATQIEKNRQSLRGRMGRRR